MTAPDRVFRFGTRGSALARWQTDRVATLLANSHPGVTIETILVRTEGDRRLDAPLPLIGGKGVFTEELERALRDGEIDFAVHSLKDLPVEPAEGLELGAIIERGEPFDVLVSRNGLTLAELPAGATVGTSSYRRSAQVLRVRPDLRVEHIRGNVDTRLRKLKDPAGPYDAIVLAEAGVRRLHLDEVITEVLDPEAMLPAPGQGAIAAQAKRDDAGSAMLAAINHLPTQLATDAERAFLRGLGGGCALPVGSWATWAGDRLTLRGRVIAHDGSATIDCVGELVVRETAAARELGESVAREALAQGAKRLIGDVS